jgi:putative transposase
MPKQLHRYQQDGDLHFLTFSCYQRRPYLGGAASRNLFEAALERMRARYCFAVLAYVVMPEHVHLLVSEPKIGKLDRAIQALKLSVTVRRRERPFWQARYYDFNVYSAAKHTEKVRYMHRNPVVRGLAEKPEEWAWSSFRHYAAGLEGAVQIESFWTNWKRSHPTHPSQVSEARPGAPGSRRSSGCRSGRGRSAPAPGGRWKRARGPPWPARAPCA